MTPAERRTVIQALADFFTPMEEAEADRLLRAAGASTTPAGWGADDDLVKRVAFRRLLAREHNDVLEELLEFLPHDARPSITSAPDSDSPLITDSPPIAEANSMPNGPIFVVHGHSRTVLHELVRVLERGTGREVIVLHEQANAGRTILEKFEDHATGASFAAVLLTGDDEGSAKTSVDKRLRGRQNVIFELGFFFGRLGRRRVAVLLEENVEKPSDIDGLVYINLDKVGAWKQELARELEAADISVNRSRIP